MSQLDKENLDEIFNVDNNKDDEEVIDVSEEAEVEEEAVEEPEEEENIESKEKKIDEELRELLSMAKDILNNARQIVDSAPDADTLTSASELVNSVTGIIRELSRSIQNDKKHKQAKELENLKAKHKKEIAKMKEKQLQLGDGNQLYLQQNYYDNSNDSSQTPSIPFKQEEIVKKLNEEEKNNGNGSS